jgi:putative FmdB family regulatory protein
MPLYEFQCESCEHRFEKIQKYTDPVPEVCPACGAGGVRKLASSPAIQFKGTGWYITDYAKKSGTDAGKSGSGKSEGGEKSDSSSSGDKAETSKPAAAGTAEAPAAKGDTPAATKTGT